MKRHGACVATVNVTYIKKILFPDVSGYTTKSDDAPTGAERSERLYPRRAEVIDPLAPVPD